MDTAVSLGTLAEWPLFLPQNIIIILFFFFHSFDFRSYAESGRAFCPVIFLWILSQNITDEVPTSVVTSLHDGVPGV